LAICPNSPEEEIDWRSARILWRKKLIGDKPSVIPGINIKKKKQNTNQRLAKISSDSHSLSNFCVTPKTQGMTGAEI
jgi:hypothetical protein